MFWQNSASSLAETQLITGPKYKQSQKLQKCQRSQAQRYEFKRVTDPCARGACAALGCPRASAAAA